MARESPASDQPMAADALEGDVYVWTGKGGDIFLTPEAALASLEPLRTAAEKALHKTHTSLFQEEKPIDSGEPVPRRR